MHAELLRKEDNLKKASGQEFYQRTLQAQMLEYTVDRRMNVGHESPNFVSQYSAFEPCCRKIPFDFLS